jgi:hypothetical protein
MANLPATIMGGISPIQDGLASTTPNNTAATAVTAKEAIRAFLGPKNFLIPPLANPEAPSASEATTLLTNILPGMYFI